MELSEKDRQLRAEYRRELDEQFRRYRAGRLPAGFTRLVVTSDIGVVFATAVSCGHGR